ncbi:hypothetical protein HMPREF0673_01706, partial [Leyella stercorea DSM 18206]
MQNVNTLCIAAQSPQGTHATYGIVQRTESDRAADAIRWQREHFQGALLGGALVSARLCRLPEQEVHQQSRRGESVPQNTRNTQNLLAEKCLPQIDTDAHRLGGYG